MRPFQIMTDTDSDIPMSYAKEKNILLVPQYTLLDGVTYEGAEGIDPADFYNRMKAGAQPQSQAINPQVCEDKFRAVLEQGKDIIYISFSAELSGSYNTACMVGKNLEEEYEGSRVYVYDSATASLGQTLMVMHAVEMQEAGEDFDAITKWLEEIKAHTIVMFTVDDLHHLQRGGRLSKASAFVGSLINIKPMMAVNDEGKLVATGKVRGRKAAMNYLIDVMEERITDEWKSLSKRVGICHGNCKEDAEKMAAMMKERLGVEEVVIQDINPSIGVHSGPGTIMIAFFGSVRVAPEAK